MNTNSVCMKKTKLLTYTRLFSFCRGISQLRQASLQAVGGDGPVQNWLKPTKSVRLDSKSTWLILFPEELLLGRLLFCFLCFESGHVSQSSFQRSCLFDRSQTALFTGAVFTVSDWCRLMDWTECQRRTRKRACYCLLWVQRPHMSRNCCVSLGRGTLGALWASVCFRLATGWCMVAADLTAVVHCLMELRYNLLHWLCFLGPRCYNQQLMIGHHEPNNQSVYLV